MAWLDLAFSGADAGPSWAVGAFATNERITRITPSSRKTSKRGLTFPSTKPIRRHYQEEGPPQAWEEAGELRWSLWESVFLAEGTGLAASGGATRGSRLSISFNPSISLFRLPLASMLGVARSARGNFNSPAFNNAGIPAVDDALVVHGCSSKPRDLIRNRT
jgi:hypothetical protein